MPASPLTAARQSTSSSEAVREITPSSEASPSKISSSGSSSGDNDTARTGIIAGSVVGGVVVLAAMGLLALFTMRRSRERHAAAREGAVMDTGYTFLEHKGPVQPVHSYSLGSYVSSPVEMDGERDLSELPETRY